MYYGGHATPKCMTTPVIGKNSWGDKQSLRKWGFVQKQSIQKQKKMLGTLFFKFPWQSQPKS